MRRTYCSTLNFKLTTYNSINVLYTYIIFIHLFIYYSHVFVYGLYSLRIFTIFTIFSMFATCIIISLFDLLIDLYSYLAIESRIGTVSLQVGHSHSFQSCSTPISDRPKHAVDSVCLRDVHHEHGANALLCCALLLTSISKWKREQGQVSTLNIWFGEA